MHRYRSQPCAAVSDADVGRAVRLSGWVVNVRDLGKLAFVRIRDAGGAMQIVAREPALVDACRQLKSGWTVTVDGELASRPGGNVKANDATGGFELELRNIVVISRGLDAEQAASLDACRLEDPARDALRRLGFTNAGASDTRLARYLAHEERVHRVRTVRAADGGIDGGGRDASVLELAFAFAAYDELVDVVCAVYGALEPLLGSAGALQVVSAPSTSAEILGPLQDAALLLTGLPSSGHVIFGGRDLCMTLLARPSFPADVVACAVLVVRGRVVGAGSVLADDRDGLAKRIEALGPLDPITRYEIEDAVAATKGETVPGQAWFAIDLDRLWTAASSTESRIGDVQLLQRDLSSLLRVLDADRLGPSTPAAVAAAARQVELRELEAYAAMIQSRLAAGGNQSRGPEAGLDSLLTDFAMDADVWQALLELDPGARERLARRAPGERFQWLWSILGNEHIRVALRSPTSYDAIGRVIELGIVTDLQQLRYLDRVSLDELCIIADDLPPSSPTLRVLRQALALSPASFSGLVAALAAAGAPREVAQADAGAVLEATRHWLCAPGLLGLGLHAAHRERDLEAVLGAVRGVGAQILLNRPVDREELIGSFAAAVRERNPELGATVAEPGDELASALLQHVFRPVSLTYAEATRTMTELADHCADIGAAGLATGGRHWSATAGCYVFPDPPSGHDAMRMYLSKNRPSFLAKATVGICTSRDAELWARADHFHLNVVDATAGVVVGNVQLHVLDRGGRRILLIRAVNASIAYLTPARARAFVEGALVACLEIAAASEIDELHLCESLSFWHLNSSRPEIRAVLEPLYLELDSIVLVPPFFLFQFGGLDIQLAKTYRLWERDRRSGAPFRLRRFLEVIA